MVLAIETWPISFDSRQASMPPLACIVPVVCLKQCGWIGQVILAFSCRFNHLVDGNPREGFPALAGEDMRSLGLLLALQSLQAIGLIAFEIMGSINAALEASDGDGAFPPINIVPAKVDELADPKPVQERHQSDHMVAVAMPIALQRRKQPVEFILGERLALAEACLV